MRRNLASAAPAAFLTLTTAGLSVHEPTPPATNADVAVRDILLRNAKGFEAGEPEIEEMKNVQYRLSDIKPSIDRKSAPLPLQRK
jgi:hypothetical protein